jgi:hypothetical protein
MTLHHINKLCGLSHKLTTVGQTNNSNIAAIKKVMLAISLDLVIDGSSHRYSPTGLL